MRIPISGRVFFCLLALPLFTTCGALLRDGQDVQAVELLHFNGWNETWAYRMDSVGRVQALHLNVDTPDSAVYCFALSEAQRAHVLTLAAAAVRLKPLKGKGRMFAVFDGPIDKVLVYRAGQTVFSYGNDPAPGYADPEGILNRLAYVLLEADGLHPNQRCAEPFSTPVLAQGHEDLFRFPRRNAHSDDSTQDQ